MIIIDRDQFNSTKEYGIKLTDQMVMESMKTPSFPSGHSTGNVNRKSSRTTKYPSLGK